MRGKETNRRVLNRRDFLSLLGASALVVAGAACKATPKPVIPVYTVEPTTTPISKDEELKYLQEGFSQIKVAINKEGLPTKYILPDGKEFILDPLYTKQAREKAIALREPEVLTYVSFPRKEENLPFNFEPEKEHPLVSELPGDTVSEEKLTRRGIGIIQGRDTKLYLRKNAFNLGELFDDHVVGYFKKVIIALIDGPKISNIFTDNSKYKEIQHIIQRYFTVSDQKLQELKQESIEDLSKSVREESAELAELKKTSPNDNGKIEFQASFLLDMKSLLTARRDTANDYQLVLSVSPLGSFVPTEISQMPDTSVILLAVGKMQPREEVSIYFDEMGKCRLFDHAGILWRIGDDKRPFPWQTHPEPSPFFTYSDGTNTASYVYADDRTGFGLRHEMVHRKALENPVNGHTHTESEADIKAMESIQKAWSIWKESEFTDDLGYYIVFKNKDDEGYILTKKGKPDNSLSA